MICSIILDERAGLIVVIFFECKLQDCGAGEEWTAARREGLVERGGREEGHLHCRNNLS